MLTAKAAGALAERFALGSRARLEGPAARGQLGQVWRLSTVNGRFAVKEWFAHPDLDATRRSADFAERVWAAGVVTPRVIRTRDGDVTTLIDDTMVRVYEWVDLRPRTRRLDPVGVGVALARLHLAGPPTHDPVDRWFAQGFGPVPWYALYERLVDDHAPFIDELAPLVGALVEVESIMEAHEKPILCHRDLWADNVLATRDGQVCVIDFDNLGPADPSQELAMVLYEFGDGDSTRACALYRAYVREGGPARVTRAGHFTMLVAQLSHICHLAAARWVGEDDPVEKARLEEWFREVLVDPVTLTRIERILEALR